MDIKKNAKAFSNFVTVAIPDDAAPFVRKNQILGICVKQSRLSVTKFNTTDLKPIAVSVYLDSQLEQLAMNPWCTPEWIGVRHLKNKVTDLRADRRPSGTFESGLELPEQLETLSMPPDDSFGFDDDQWLLPVAPKTTKHDPKKTVFCSNLRPLLMTFQDGQLLAERKVFQSQIGILLRSK